MKQKVIANTNLMYDYGLGNLQTISRIEIKNANVDVKQNYYCYLARSKYYFFL